MTGTEVDNVKIGDLARVDGVGVLIPVDAAATGNVTPLSGAKTVDGVALTAGDRVLLPLQSTSLQRGVWVVQSGSWTRPKDFPDGGFVKGRSVVVLGGTGAPKEYVLQVAPGATCHIGVSAQTWTSLTAVPITLDVELVATLDHQGNGSGWMVKDEARSILYVELSNDAKVKSYDISAPGPPVFLDEITVGAANAYIGVVGNYVLVTDQGDLKLRVIDATDPANLAILGTPLVYSAGGAAKGAGGGRFAVDPHNQYMLIGGPETGTGDGTNANKHCLVDISNLAAPVAKGTIVKGIGPSRGVTWTRNREFALSSRDDHKVYRINYADPSTLTETESFVVPHTITTPLASTGNLLLVGGYSGWLDIYDDSGATSTLLGSVEIGAGCESINIDGSLATIALRTPGEFVVVDFFDPTDPQVVARGESSNPVGSPATYSAVMHKGRIYFSSNGDTDNGIIDVFDVTDNLPNRVTRVENQIGDSTAAMLAPSGISNLRDSLSANTNYLVSTTRPSFVRVRGDMILDQGDSGTILFRVGLAGATVIYDDPDFSLTDASTAQVRATFDCAFFLPPGHVYRIEQQNDGGTPQFGAYKAQEFVL